MFVLTLRLNIVWNSSLISYCLTSPSLTLLFLRCLPDNLLCLFCVVLVDFVLAFQSGFPLMTIISFFSILLLIIICLAWLPSLVGLKLNL